jgi:hypothetical protein
MNEQFSQRNPAVRTLQDYLQLLAILRHFADRAQRLALRATDLESAAMQYSSKAHFERNIARIQDALSNHHVSIADVIITEER